MHEAYLHRGGDEPLTGDTIDARLRAVVAAHGEREAVVAIPQQRRLTYAQLDREVDALARGLLALGTRRGDRVGIWSTNNVEWLLLQLATARVGAVLVNVNPAYRQGELEHALRLARVQVLVLIPRFKSSDYVGMARALVPELDDCAADGLHCARLPELRRVVVYDPADPMSTARPTPGFTLWRDLLAAGQGVTDAAMAARAASNDCDDPINIQFTSGTTGAPKAVLLTHHNILNNAWFAGGEMGVTERDRLAVSVPFYHCFGMVLCNLLCLVRGAALVIPAEHFDVEATLDAIEAERCTVLHGVPTMFIAELELIDHEAHDTSSLRTGIMAGAPCPPELIRRVADKLNLTDIRIGYGQTEASPLTHLSRDDVPLERRARTVGTNLPHQEVKVIDTSTGARVAQGEPGEVCFRGYHVMRGYYAQPEATAKTIDAAGWLRSGDIGVLDPDGELRITGRLKEMIIRGGENIYPAEIEAFYHTHPAVAQVAVFGVKDERLGEEVGAWFQLHEGLPDDQRPDADALRAYARDRVAHFKVPRYVWIVDDFPMTVTGKIQKYRIQEIVAGWLPEGADGERRRE